MWPSNICHTRASHNRACDVAFAWLGFSDTMYLIAFIASWRIGDAHPYSLGLCRSPRLWIEFHLVPASFFWGSNVKGLPAAIWNVSRTGIWVGWPFMFSIMLWNQAPYSWQLNVAARRTRFFYWYWTTIFDILGWRCSLLCWRRRGIISWGPEEAGNAIVREEERVSQIERQVLCPSRGKLDMSMGDRCKQCAPSHASS